MKRLILLALATTLAFAQAPPTRKPIAPPAKVVAPAATPIAGGFVGNKDSKILHKSDCKSVTKMKDKNKVPFGSKDEALKAGYKPCKACKP